MGQGLGPDAQKGQPGLGRAALFGLCPRCGARTLFEAPARIALSCDACGLDLGALERGGRLAGVLTMVLAVFLIGAALGVDAVLRPPLWLSALVWAPLTVGAVVFALRFYRTTLLYRQYEAARAKEPAQP
ncbi:Uncharacterized conserved protein, DUF983 family [Erythrobacter litoralis]|jgi:uncharacterized protein (DUF983 family)|uniref:DUF983 domain-containing protein n=1 Tax=Erythrobacter litoralis TaxID=39960 RepID=A0A074N2P2_9SPHN|nr:DUF983 domain-containing protein [Erythrobacter litoralis]AOL24080.1 Uncharacterized conserved protein, DUF983 family [Erythrobacter litoralis]KEO98448.1 hypothetical protein EH32_04870 [Erythrobacter litoralis]MEE4337198.1 DUF983 domain-containing protein [Erythrobacter sp.]